MTTTTENVQVPPADKAPVATAPARRALPIPQIILAVVLLAGVVYGAQRWMWGRTHIESDNAQIEGNVVPALARVSGFVTNVAVVENQAVKAGDLLVQLDDRDLKSRLAQAEADLRAAIANAGEKGHPGQFEAQIAAAEAAVSQAEANAAKAHQDLDRYETLAPRNVISRQQLDGARAASEAADAALLAARKQVQAAQAGWQGADARVAALAAARDQAALQLSYTRIAAPQSGVVSRKTVELGQYLQPGQATMSVVPLDDVWLVANLKETEVEKVRPGDTVKITVDAYPHHEFKGHVQSLSPATGAKFSLLPPDNATGNFTKVVQRIPVRVVVDGPADAQFPLRPGMSATVTITTR